MDYKVPALILSLILALGALVTITELEFENRSGAAVESTLAADCSAEDCPRCSTSSDCEWPRYCSQGICVS